MDALRDGVASPTPGPLLGAVGLLPSVAAGADDPGATLEDHVRSPAGVDRVETSAALLAIATLTVDAELRRRVRRGTADRGHVNPRWLVELDRTEPVDRAVEVSTVFRDADDPPSAARPCSVRAEHSCHGGQPAFTGLACGQRAQRQPRVLQQRLPAAACRRELLDDPPLPAAAVSRGDRPVYCPPA
ncbi:hypothetical protein ACI79D_09780 [Geodermatophilus sp. SYSU D00708]